jgi:hypothetical protein
MAVQVKSHPIASAVVVVLSYGRLPGDIDPQVAAREKRVVEINTFDVAVRVRGFQRI